LKENVELTYKIIEFLAKEASSKEYHKFTSKAITRKIGEYENIRKVNQIMKRLFKEGIIKFYEKTGYYCLSSEDLHKLNEYMRELNNTLLLSYHQPLSRIEPPINVYRMLNGKRKLIARARRESILKAIYHIEGEEDYKVVFRTYKFSGFSIIKEGETIFEAYRAGFRKPIEAVYNGENIIIRRKWGREIAVLNRKGEKIGCMKSSGIEKATFTYREPLNEISIPLSVALYAIKQLDVII